MNEIEALYAKVYFAKEMDQILKETILIMLKQMIIGGGGTVPDLSNYPTNSEMESYVSGQLIGKLDKSLFDTEIIKKVDTSIFNSEISNINTELTKKLIASDLVPLDTKISTKVETTTFNTQVTATNNKIANDISVSRTNILSEVNNDFLPRSEFVRSDLNIVFYDGKEIIEPTATPTIWNGSVSSVGGEWTIDYSSASFTEIPNITLTVIDNDGFGVINAVVNGRTLTTTECSGTVSGGDGTIQIMAIGF